MTRARSRKAHEVRKQRRASTRKRNLKHGYKPRRAKTGRAVVTTEPRSLKLVDTRALFGIVKRLTAVV